MEINDAVRIALDGDAVLFTGAGLGFLSKNMAGAKLPDGDVLKDLLLKQPIGTGSLHPLDRVAGHAVRTHGVDDTYNILKEQLTVVEIDPALKEIYNLPWRRIYTTNYDNAAELARQGCSVSNSLTLDDEISNARAGSIVHINGDISKVSPSNLDKDLALSDRSYAASRLQESDWFSYFIRDMKAAKSVIFAGYSLYDLDITRALIADESLSRKTFFFISPAADDIECDAIRPYGAVVPGGVLELRDVISKVSSDYEPSDHSHGFTALEEIEPTSEVIDKANAQKLYDQLVYGRLQENEFLNDELVFADQPFLVTRKQDKDAIEAFRKGPWRDVVYVGEIASGKTTSCLIMAKYLLQSGYKAYYAKKSDALASELATLAKSDEKCVIIFENYAAHTSDIRDFASRRTQNQRIIMSARSVSHELIDDFVGKTPHLGPVFEVHLDKIAPADVEQFENLVNFGGFWGERSGVSERSRRGIITNKLDSSLYRLLIEVIESEKVQLDVERLLSPLLPNRRALKLFVSSFIINVLGHEFSLNDWQTVFEAQWVRRVMNTYAEQVQNFLSIRGDRIFPRTGVLSAHILKNISDNDLIRECLVGLYERTIRGEANDDVLKSLRIKLTRYGSIENIFTTKNRSNNIFRYYDDIRVFGNTRNNSDYWLQVGIAATIHEDLPRAEKAFENAYAREKAKHSPNLKKIDNYFSRYEMRLAISEANSSEAFKIFSRASERLKKQMFLDTDRHYPYKTGRNYADVAARHYDHWLPSQKEAFIRETREIRDQAFAWKDAGNQYSVDVEILISETTKLLEKLEIPKS